MEHKMFAPVGIWNSELDISKRYCDIIAKHREKLATKISISTEVSDKMTNSQTCVQQTDMEITKNDCLWQVTA